MAQRKLVALLYGCTFGLILMLPLFMFMRKSWFPGKKQKLIRGSSTVGGAIKGLFREDSKASSTSSVGTRSTSSVDTMSTSSVDTMSTSSVDLRSTSSIGTRSTSLVGARSNSSVSTKSTSTVNIMRSTSSVNITRSTSSVNISRSASPLDCRSVSSMGLDLSETLLPPPKTSFSFRINGPCFTTRQEDDKQRFDWFLGEKPLLLEDYQVDCNEGKRAVKGTLAVSDSKVNDIFVRYTKDAWKSFTDVPAELVSSDHTSGDLSFNRCEFKLPFDFDLGSVGTEGEEFGSDEQLNAMVSKWSCNMEFAICYRVDDKEMWDNNRSKNFQVNLSSFIQA